SALGVQRDLAQERGRRRYAPDDHDAAQLDWLRATLDGLEEERPNGWRVLVLHHPLFSTIRNHCEHSEIQETRANLLPIVANRVHLVLSGHSHAFEWLRCEQMPHAGLFVTGGGGQVGLRRSLLDPHYFQRYRDRYQALCRAGALECAVGGRGPAAPDGENGFLYHYLRVEVRRDMLRIIPVGVRRLRSGEYRREEPMPVYHAPDLPGSGGWMTAGREHPGWHPRRLRAVEVRRDRPPRPLWE
ncbi:MAG TPA: hypothetical protein VFU47_09385, partial [Armatimonadota bacterium]|nr:hypothetical protein [Armatimonadota bacterium]